jgi:hypothetical protein
MAPRNRAAMSATAVAAIGLTIAPTAAHAAPPHASGVVERTPMVDSWIYSDGELFVFTGPEAVGCSGPPDFELFDVTVVSPPSGGSRTTSAHRESVYVYDADGFVDPFAWMGAVCSKGQGDPVPLATGAGMVVHTIHTDADGNLVSHGGTTTAQLTTADAGTAHVTAQGVPGTWGTDVIRYTG